jgi:hypothetical protein
MIPAVFRIDEDRKVVIDQDAKKLIPEIDMVKDVDLLYIVLAYDHVYSPYRFKPKEERIAIARKRIYGSDTIIPEDNKKIKKAIEEYLKLIFDPRRETLEMFKDKIVLLHKEIKNNQSDIKEIKKSYELIEFFEQKIDELKKELDTEEHSIYIKGDKKLSKLEIWQRNYMKANKE